MSESTNYEINVTGNAVGLDPLLAKLADLDAAITGVGAGDLPGLVRFAQMIQTFPALAAEATAANIDMTASARALSEALGANIEGLSTVIGLANKASSGVFAGVSEGGLDAGIAGLREFTAASEAAAGAQDAAAASATRMITPAEAQAAAWERAAAAVSGYGSQLALFAATPIAAAAESAQAATLGAGTGAHSPTGVAGQGDLFSEQEAAAAALAQEAAAAAKLAAQQEAAAARLQANVDTLAATGKSGSELAKAMQTFGLTLAQLNNEQRAQLGLPLAIADEQRAQLALLAEGSAVQLRAYVTAQEEAAARTNLTRLLAQEGASEAEVTAAARKLAITMGANATAQEKAAAEGGGGGGGLFGGLFGGGGNNDSGIGQLVTAAKFIAFYQAYILVQRALTDAFNATVQYDRSVTNLGISLQGTGTDVGALADQLGRVATNAGLAAAAGVDAGTSFIRAFPNADPTQAANAGANAAATLNVIGDPKTIQSDLTDTRAVLADFNLGVEGTARVLDVATSAAQNFGFATASDILPGLAQIGDLAAASGFTLEQTANTIGAIRQRTGESADAAAGELRRFLGREGNNAFQQVFQSYGIDITQQFADELKQFAPIFNNLAQPAQAAIVGQLGGGRAGAAVQALLSGYDETQKAAEKSAESQGLAADQVAKRLGDLRGLLTQLSGDFKQLAVDVGQTGIFDFFGLLLEGLNPLLRGVDDLIQLFDKLPTAVRASVTAGLELAAVLALINKEAEGGLFGVVGNLAVGIKGALGLGGGVAASETAANLAAAGPEGAALASGAAATEGAAATVGSIAIYAAPAIAGLIALGAIKSSVDAFNKAVGDGTRATQNLLGASTAQQFLNARDSLQTAANEIKTGFFDRLVNPDAVATKRRLEDQAKFAAQQAATISSQSGGTPFSAFGPSGTDLAQGFAYLKNAGLGASDNIKLVSDALNLLNGTASRSAQGIKASAQEIDTINAAAFSGLTSAADITAKLGISGQGALTGEAGRAAYLRGGGVTGSRATAVAADLAKIDPRQIADAQNAELGLLGLNSNSALSSAQVQQVLSAGADAAFKNIGLTKDEFTKLKEQYVSQGLAAFKAQQDANSQAALGTISPQALAALVDQTGGLDSVIKQQIQGIQAELSPLQQGRDVQSLLREYDTALAIAVKSGNQADISTVLAEKNQVDAEAATILQANLKAQIDAINATNASAASKRAQIISLVKAVAIEFAKEGNEAALIAVLNGLDAAAVASVERSIKTIADTAISAAAAAADVQAHAAAAAAAAAASLPDGVTNKGVIDAFNKGAADAKAAQTVQQQQTSNASQVLKDIQGFVAPSAQDFGNAAKGAAGAAKKAGELAAAIIEASAIPGDALSQASTAMRAAQAKIQDYVKGTTEWYQAIKALHDAQYQYGLAVLAQANAAQLLAGDVTDPVVQARDKVLADLQKLRFDKGRGAGTTADQLQLKQDQAAAEKAAFDQKFADEKTAYDLNQISYSAYLSYLQSQHNLLTSVHSKTRQQIDELNQVDQALQAAQGQLSGQFNIGAIKLPTIYEVRRSIAATAAGLSYQSNTQNTIYITGTDTAAVKQVIQDVLGPTASQVRTIAPRKA